MPNDARGCLAPRPSGADHRSGEGASRAAVVRPDTGSNLMTAGKEPAMRRRFVRSAPPLVKKKASMSPGVICRELVAQSRSTSVA